MINPILAGGMQYYGRFYRSVLYPLLMRINAYLVRWIRQVRTVEEETQSPRVHAGNHREVSPDVQALEMGDSGLFGLTTKMTRAV
jgi:Group II intron, maturase-specific domain